MGPIERAIRAKFKVRVTLRTVGQGKPFVVRPTVDEGVDLLLGGGEWQTHLTGECLESVVPFLGSQPGWVPAGGKFSVAGEPGTLDQHLKRYVKRDVARWLTVVLRDAGVVEVDEGPPLRLRLSERFALQAAQDADRAVTGATSLPLIAAHGPLDTGGRWACPKDGTAMTPLGRRGRGGAYRCLTCRGVFLDVAAMRRGRGGQPPMWAPFVMSLLISLLATFVVRRLRRRLSKQTPS